jgi:solute carrier family 25 carnitine/acylcarnitine transporter 20/29
MNEFLYGTIGGMTGILLSHPIDTIKTRLQSKQASTVKDALLQKKLYAGLVPPLIGVMLEKSIVFGCYDMANKKGYHPMISGIFGGAMSTIIVTPVDHIKIALQNKTSTISPISWRNVIKGFFPTLCRETPGFGIYFSTYSYLSRFNPEQKSYKHFLFGCASGGAAWLFIYPSDFVKTRIQSNSTGSTVSSIVKEIWNTNNPSNCFLNGIRNMYRGWSYAMMRALPLHGGVFLGYEYSKRLF